MIVGGVSAAVSKTAAAPIERIKLLVQNQVCATAVPVAISTNRYTLAVLWPQFATSAGHREPVSRAIHVDYPCPGWLPGHGLH